MTLLRAKPFVTLCIGLAALGFAHNVAPVIAQPGQTQHVSAQPVMVTAGEEEVVFNWRRDRCDNEDIPDLPARAFRDAEGQTQLVATHYVARRSVGPDLNTLTHACDIVLRPNLNADPAMFSDKEWIASLFTEDGSTIHAVLHNEYQGHTHSGQCPSGEYFNCWYNALTTAISTDGGRAYVRSPAPPDHLVAALPYPYEAEAGPYGLFEPSNMIVGPDDAIYLFVKHDHYRSPRQEVCLLRTDNVADPAAWRAWDGDGFDLPLSNPYRQPVQDPEQSLCAAVSPSQIGTMHESITYNRYLNRYVLVGISADSIDGREVWGVYYAFSNDLLAWTPRQLLFEAELPWTYSPGDPNPILYPSLLDPDSPSRTYESTDQSAYLYFTRFNYQHDQMTLDRDLIRVPVQFFRSETEQQNPEAVTNLTLELDRAANAVTATLSRHDSNPIRGATIHWTARPLNDSDYETTFTGQVPENATRALVGYRVNTECGCSGPADFALYEVRYVEGGAAVNLIPNPRFSQGLSMWSTTGGGDQRLVESDRGDGQMLRVMAEPGETAALNSEVFPVEAGATYTITYVMRINSATANSGYLALMFLDQSGEIGREQFDLRPNHFALGNGVTDAMGTIRLSLDPAAQPPYVLEARFPGSDAQLPAQAEIVVETSA